MSLKRALRIVTAGALLAASTLAATPARADVEACAAAAEDSERALKKEHLKEARARVGACLAAECPAVLRASCAETLASIEASSASIVVSVRRGDGTDVVDARIRLDDADLKTGGTIEVDPGKHVLEATEGGRTVRLEVLARSGEKRRAVVMLLDDKPAAPLPPVPPPAPPERRSPRWLGPGLLGLGGLGLASFTFFGLSARSDVDKLEQDCKPYCSSDRIDDGRTKALVADVSLGVAVVALAAGAYFLFVAK